MSKRALQHSFSLLNADYVQLTSRWNYRGIVSPYHRIYYIDAGEGEISDLEKTVHLEAGYLYIIPSFTLCNLYCKYSLSQYFIQFFEDSSNGISVFVNHRSILKIQAKELDIQLFKRLLEINPGRGINRSDNPKLYEKEVYYEEYQAYNNQQSMPVYLETQGIIIQLVARFLSFCRTSEREKQVIPIKLTETLNYISSHLDQTLSISQLASRINQSADYFSRRFKQHTGKRPANYINEKRIERAQYLITTTKMTFSQITARTGFENLSYFSKTFKKFTGMSPRDFKKQADLTSLY